MASSTAIVRHARHEDAPAILELIQALADYEKMPHAVEATVESLRRTIAFASPATAAEPGASPDLEPTSAARPARCLLLFSPEGRAVGMALYFYNYSTWRGRPGIYLEDLFVQPSERHKGYGTRMLVQLARDVVTFNGGRLEWSVLKWNEPSIKFYERMGAKAMNDWVGMCVDGPELHKLARFLD